MADCQGRGSSDGSERLAYQIGQISDKINRSVLVTM